MRRRRDTVHPVTLPVRRITRRRNLNQHRPHRDQLPRLHRNRPRFRDRHLLRRRHPRSSRFRRYRLPRNPPDESSIRRVELKRVRVNPRCRHRLLQHRRQRRILRRISEAPLPRSPAEKLAKRLVRFPHRSMAKLIPANHCSLRHRITPSTSTRLVNPRRTDRAQSHHCRRLPSLKRTARFLR